MYSVDCRSQIVEAGLGILGKGMEESGGEAVSIEDLEDPEVEALVGLLEVQRRGGDEYGVAACRIHDHYPPITSSANLVGTTGINGDWLLKKEVDRDVCSSSW
jgi:hypothetical protein